MQFILAILLYVLGAVAVISVGGLFGVAVTIGQAASVWIVLTLVVSIIKNI